MYLNTLESVLINQCVQTCKINSTTMCLNQMCYCHRLQFFFSCPEGRVIHSHPPSHSECVCVCVCLWGASGLFVRQWCVLIRHQRCGDCLFSVLHLYLLLLDRPQRWDSPTVPAGLCCILSFCQPAITYCNTTGQAFNLLAVRMRMLNPNIIIMWCDFWSRSISLILA